MHGPVLGLHADPPSIVDAGPQTRTPLEFGRHSAPLQQSPLNAHVCPVVRHGKPPSASPGLLIAWQRGTPTLSSVHAFESPTAPQQSLRDEEPALHAYAVVLLKWQTSPSGLQPCGFWHTPTGAAVPALLHVTGVLDVGSPASGSPPQQSSPVRQRSPLTWQPFAGWQMSTPVSAYGAQSRLQHDPHELHTVPSTPPLQFVAPAGGGAQVPTVAPLAMVHTLLQHCDPVEQTSLV